DCYSTREDGTEDSSACADHHDRLEALYAEANDTMAALDSHLDTGGPRPPPAPAPATSCTVRAASVRRRRVPR
ncbi:hypothetical protein, partial [Nocardia asiatica]|uniref:hypothetical protein n=1 Tax=Nocardia asiatica TaxID=209252 RepID=UPI00245838A2